MRIEYVIISVVLLLIVIVAMVVLGKDLLPTIQSVFGNYTGIR